MTDYKSTLNLPYTDFPMKANLAQREPLCLQRWIEQDVYAQLRAARKGKPVFRFLDGPPYANGHLHLGHAVNKILKDIVVKAKGLDGLDVPFVPGWDCHGLPVEINVEKKEGRPGDRLTHDAFRAACRAYANHYVAIQKDEFKRLGVMADWHHPYLTMDYTYEANIIRSLAKVHAAHHLKRGRKPVHFCLDCRSALAEAEVEYKEKQSQAIDVRFQAADVAEVFARFGVTDKKDWQPVTLPVWTTTPWTLPANEAVALNPALTYALIGTPAERWIVAKDMIRDVLLRCNYYGYYEIGEAQGSVLEGILMTHPLYPDRQVPIIMSNHVVVGEGTAAVHVAPAHGPEDYALLQYYALPFRQYVNQKGCYTEEVPLFAGLSIREANEPIINALKEDKKLLSQATLTHSYPHCWRHHTPLIMLATPQWFIDLAGPVREKALQVAAHEVTWHPKWGKARMQGLIESRPDWCLSRQRTWGVPMPLFVHQDTGELHPNTAALMEKVAKQVEQFGVDVWYQTSVEDWLGADAAQYEKIQDVLDVWFDSGVAHACLQESTTDLVLEGSDQYRAWFQSLLLSSVAMGDGAPFKIALAHGFVVDANGHKMSKSLGNVIAPDEITKTLGADILRLWVASIDYRDEIAAGKDAFNTTTETYRRIRNTLRFLLANLHGFDPLQHLVPAHEMLALDRVIVEKARVLQAELIEAYQAYQFHIVVQKIHHFCLDDLGRFYLDIIKDRQYTMQTNSLGRRSAQTALYHIAHAFARWMMPILSFTTEELWDYLPGKQESSVLLTTWYDGLAALPADALFNVAYVEKLQTVRDAVNKAIEGLRAAGVLGSSLEAAIWLYCAPDLYALLQALGDELHFAFIASKATLAHLQEAPADAMVTDVAHLKLKVEAIDAAKCERCWHRVPDVGALADYPGICGRCVENIAGTGEVRRYV